MISIMAISAQESPPWSCDNTAFLAEKALLFQLKYFTSNHQFNKLPILKAFLVGEKLKQVSTF